MGVIIFYMAYNTDKKPKKQKKLLPLIMEQNIFQAEIIDKAPDSK